MDSKPFDPIFPPMDDYDATDPNALYRSPFERYASKDMRRLWSNNVKYPLWRRLWIALAKAEKIAGLDISDEQIEEMIQYADDINFDVAAAKEAENRHDVMAHVYAFGQQAISAKEIIHLGATSCFVTDNTDILITRRALQIIRGKLLGAVKILREFANEYKEMPCLGYTHLQTASLVTVGKRAAMWLQELVLCISNIDFALSQLAMLGCRGATGSADTFMKLFNGDEEACKKLEQDIVKQFQANKVFGISGQTYTRTLDSVVMNALSVVGESLHKICLDIRFLQHLHELEEPSEKGQVGSSAMPYKRNPMRAERVCALARFLCGLPAMATQTASVQMLERTLDDSACRRLYVPEAFLAADSILIVFQNILNGLIVNEEIIKQHVNEEVPLMASESILMRHSKNGGGRQEGHGELRRIAMEIGTLRRKAAIEPTKIADEVARRIEESKILKVSAEEALTMFDGSKLIGRCPGIVDDYLRDTIDPLLEKEAHAIIFDYRLAV